VALGTPALLGTPGNGTTSAATSGTPPANCRMYCWVASKNTAGTRAAAPTDNLGGAWTSCGRADSAASPAIQGDLYYQDVGPSPSALTVSTSGGVTATHIAVICDTGAQGGTDFTNIDDAADTAGDPSTVLPSAITAGSLLLSIATGHLGNTFTLPSGFTSLSNSTQGSNFRLAIAYNAAPSSQTSSWTSANTNSVALTLEVKVPVAGGPATGNFLEMFA
jgi:hypothetical protein